MEREAAKKQEELFAMEKLNDALNEKLKSLSMEVCKSILKVQLPGRLVDWVGIVILIRDYFNDLLIAR